MNLAAISYNLAQIEVSLCLHYTKNIQARFSLLYVCLVKTLKPSVKSF